jgi:hypothetical protein
MGERKSQRFCKDTLLHWLPAFAAELDSMAGRLRDFESSVRRADEFRTSAPSTTRAR